MEAGLLFARTPEIPERLALRTFADVLNFALFEWLTQSYFAKAVARRYSDPNDGWFAEFFLEFSP